ncbi:MAG: redoxin family protein [Alphaproteobacteria bacterium]|nr:redoxin family protein [Alphaproteobacteria bacterium]
MRWYGFFVIFLVSTVFCNLLLTVRWDAPEEDLVVKNFSLPQGSLKILDRPESAGLSRETMPKQPLILFFFASWCRPCQAEAPVIAKLSERHDALFIGIAVRDNIKELKAFLKKTNNPFLFVALDPKMEWTDAMYANKLPTAFILNEKSEVVAKINGFLTEDFYFQKILPFIQELKHESVR